MIWGGVVPGACSRGFHPGGFDPRGIDPRDIDPRGIDPKEHCSQFILGRIIQ